MNPAPVHSLMPDAAPRPTRSFFGPLNPGVESWAGRRVWVVGASSGIGAELARGLRRDFKARTLRARTSYGPQFLMVLGQ